MVEKIESFRAKLERSPTPEGERSNHRCVKIDESLALDKPRYEFPNVYCGGIANAFVLNRSFLDPVNPEKGFPAIFARSQVANMRNTN